MKKILITLLLLTVIVNDNIAAVITIPAYTSDIIASIQGAHNAGANGDNIILPSGTYACNGVVVLTKFISISGQGYANTVLYRSESTPDATLETWSEFFRFNINSTVSSGIRVSGIGFKSKQPCLNSTVDGNGNDVAALDGLSLARDCGVKMTKCKDFSIVGCKFENFGNAAVSIEHDDSLVGGVISNNIFLHNAKGKMASGLGYGVVIYGANIKWLSNPRFGTSNFIFVENNIFDFHKHSIAAGGCALYVFRFNKVYNNIAGSSTAAVDAHEGRGPGNGSNSFATRAIEVYYNTLENTTFRNSTGLVTDGTLISSVTPTNSNSGWLTEACIKLRGGEGRVRGNKIKGFRIGVAISVNASCGSSCGTYPIDGQTGNLSGLQLGSAHTGVAGNAGSGDLYFWNNNFTTYIATDYANKLFYNYNTDTVYVRDGRDYHRFAPVDTTMYTYPHPLAATGNPLTGITLVGTTIINSGDLVSNIYIEPKIYVYTTSIDSVVNVELPAYISYSSLQSGSSPIYPLVSNQVLSNISFKMNPSDTVKVSGTCNWGDYIQSVVNKTKSQITSQKGVITQ